MFYILRMPIHTINKMICKSIFMQQILNIHLQETKSNMKKNSLQSFSQNAYSIRANKIY